VLGLVAVSVLHTMHAASLGASLYSVVSEIAMRVEYCSNGQTRLRSVLVQAETNTSFRCAVLPLTMRWRAAPGLSDVCFHSA
jgi:hypothetical protein